MEKVHSIGRELKQLRESKGLSVEQLAEQSKTDRKFIEELESDQLVPSIAPLLKIARGLGVRLNTLIDDDPITGAVVARQAALPETELGFSGLGPYCASTLEFHPLAKNRKGRNMEPFIIDVHPSRFMRVRSSFTCSRVRSRCFTETTSTFWVSATASTTNPQDRTKSKLPAKKMPASLP
jgi:transcriptional regulator with XRE-family HTH domain